MTISPDTKDWTWVLDRACAECGFDPGTVDTASLADRLQGALAPWPELLDVESGAHGIALRPVPSTWSRLEYAGHVREVTLLMRHRLEQILDTDGARFADWDQDRAAEDGDYGTQRPSEVAAGIAEHGAELVAAFRAVPAEGWQRKGIRSDGSNFTAFRLGLYALHDLEHHLWDVTDGVPTVDPVNPDAPADPAGAATLSTGLPNPLEQLPLEQLRQRTSAKWRAFPSDVLPLWVAEMDVTPAEPIQRALIEAIRSGDTGYAYGTGYAQALQAFAADRWGWDGLAVERTSIVPDVMLGVVEMLRLVTGSGDAVVVNCPVYPPFYSFVRHLDRRIVEAPLGADRRLDLDALAEAFAVATHGGRPAAFLLCNPHNPTGTVHTAAELAAVAALADKHGVRVVADEIHAPLVLPGATFVPFLSVPGGQRGLSLMSASKGWNLAGLKAAVAIAGSEAADDLARIPEEVSHGVSHLGMIAHTAALREGGPWLDALLAGLAANRSLLGELLAEQLPAIPYSPPQATFLAWLDCRPLGIEEPVAEPGLVTLSVGPAALFLDRAKVAVSAGAAFGTGGAGHIRLNYATSAAILTEAIGRMGDAVRGLDR